MTTPPPTCCSALHGLPAASGLCAVNGLCTATGLPAAAGLCAANRLGAATWLLAATGLTASTLQPGCPLTPATGLHADARHRDGRNRPAPYYIVDLVDMVSHSANQQTIEVASHMHT